MTKQTLTKESDAGKIARDPLCFANNRYDAIIVGGGVYGVMLCLEACRRGLKPLLLEADDFGGQTSFNHLRIIHGGLRYLQNLDLKRFYESVRERAWFLTYYPDLVKPLDCLMPLYGNGLKRPAIFKPALTLNDLLTFTINRKIPLNNRLSKSRILNAHEVYKRFPMVHQKGLKGGAFWQDGFAANSPRLVIEIVRLANKKGGNALNYFRAKDLIINHEKVIGVKAQDTYFGKEYCFYGDMVVNAAGPWCRTLSERWHKDMPELFPHRILVWNILFDRKAVSKNAVAVAPPGKGTHTYFLPPWSGELMVGTGHEVVKKDDSRPPSEKEIHKMIADINSAIPELQLKREEVKRIQSGNMPGTISGNLGSREVIVNHGNKGGPIGLFSVSGVKFTTARLVADKFLSSVYPQCNPQNYETFIADTQKRNIDEKYLLSSTEALNDIIVKESVIKLSDLLMRRTNLVELPELSKKIKEPPLADLVNQRSDWEDEVNTVLQFNGS